MIRIDERFVPTAQLWNPCTREYEPLKTARIDGIQEDIGGGDVVIFICSHCGEFHRSLVWLKMSSDTKEVSSGTP